MFVFMFVFMLYPRLLFRLLFEKENEEGREETFSSAPEGRPRRVEEAFDEDGGRGARMRRRVAAALWRSWRMRRVVLAGRREADTRRVGALLITGPRAFFLGLKYTEVARAGTTAIRNVEEL